MGTITALLAFSRTGIGQVVTHALEAIGLILLLLAFKAGYDHKYEAIGAAKEHQKTVAVQAAWDADKQARLKAFSQLETQYVAAQQQADATQQQLATERQARVEAAKQAAANLPAAVANMRIPAAALGVLDAAIGAPEPAPAQSPAEPADSPPAVAADTTLGILAQWAVSAIDEYNACRDEVIGWQSFYRSLQQAPEVK